MLRIMIVTIFLLLLVGGCDSQDSHPPIGQIPQEQNEVGEPEKPRFEPHTEPVKPVFEPPTVYGRLYTQEDVNLRSGPGKGYKSITIVSRGTVVELHSDPKLDQSDWLPVQANGKIGYINRRYLGDRAPMVPLEYGIKYRLEEGFADGFIEMTKITVTNKETIMDFTIKNNSEYAQEFSIAPPGHLIAFYIIDAHTGDEYRLIDVEGVNANYRPIVLQSGESSRFRLFFEPLKDSVEKIHVIEGKAEDGVSLMWRFMNITLEKG